MSQLHVSHTCPLCATVLHRSGPYTAWTTPDGRVILEGDTARPTDQRWLELPPAAQNWLAEVFRLAREQTIEANASQPAGYVRQGTKPMRNI